MCMVGFRSASRYLYQHVQNLQVDESLSPRDTPCYRFWGHSSNPSRLTSCLCGAYAPVDTIKLNGETLATSAGPLSSDLHCFMVQTLEDAAWVLILDSLWTCFLSSLCLRLLVYSVRILTVLTSQRGCGKESFEYWLLSLGLVKILDFYLKCKVKPFQGFKQASGMI